MYVVVSLLLFGGVMFFNHVRAQTFGKPTAPAPSSPGLNVFTNTSDFVKLNDPTSQTIKGQLVIASSTQASAIVGDFTNSASITGFAGITVAPPALPVGVSGAALYGYSFSGTAGAGAYGYAAGATSAGVVGETRDQGLAGTFLGQVKIASPGTLTVDDVITAPEVSGRSSVLAVPGIYSTNGITATGRFFQGISTVTGTNYGLYGRSSTTLGLYAVNTAASVSGSNFYGIRGDTADTIGKAGLFGYSVLGNGIAGINGSASTISAVHGEVIGASRGATDYSSAIYGRGGAYAGYFEGDVKIQNGLLYINRTGITEAVLVKLLEWTCGTPRTSPSDPNCDPY